MPSKEGISGALLNGKPLVAIGIWRAISKNDASPESISEDNSSQYSFEGGWGLLGDVNSLACRGGSASAWTKGDQE